MLNYSVAELRNKKNNKNNIIHYEWKKENVVFVVLLLFMPTLL